MNFEPIFTGGRAPLDVSEGSNVNRTQPAGTDHPQKREVKESMRPRSETKIGVLAVAHACPANAPLTRSARPPRPASCRLQPPL